MKTMKIKLMMLAFTLIALAACETEDNSAAPDTGTIVKNGKWKITLYNDSGKDETSTFTGYEFSFLELGTLKAVKSKTTVEGIWSSGTDDSQKKLIIDFGSKAPFDELNDDWHIMNETSTMMQLEDVSGGSGEIDLLTFEKVQ